jgi:hypothetical protein
MREGYVPAVKVYDRAPDVLQELEEELEIAKQSA